MLWYSGNDDDHDDTLSFIFFQFQWSGSAQLAGRELTPLGRKYTCSGAVMRLTLLLSTACLIKSLQLTKTVFITVHTVHGHGKFVNV
jgi:hypothetical protein